MVYGIPLIGFAVLCVLFVVFELHPGRAARRGRNAWIGIRTHRMLASDNNWVDGHKMIWPWAVAGTTIACVCLLAGAAASMVSDDPEQASGLAALVGTLAFGVSLTVGVVRADRHLKQRDQERLGQAGLDQDSTA